MKAALIAKWQVSRKKPQALADHPNTPPHFPWIWQWFQSMKPGFGYPDLEAWSRISGQDLQGWEAELLLRLDALR